MTAKNWIFYDFSLEEDRTLFFVFPDCLIFCTSSWIGCLTNSIKKLWITFLHFKLTTLSFLLLNCYLFLWQCHVTNNYFSTMYWWLLNLPVLGLAAKQIKLKKLWATFVHFKLTKLSCVLLNCYLFFSDNVTFTNNHSSAIYWWLLNRPLNGLKKIGT